MFVFLHISLQTVALLRDSLTITDHMQIVGMSQNLPCIARADPYIWNCHELSGSDPWYFRIFFRA